MTMVFSVPYMIETWLKICRLCMVGVLHDIAPIRAYRRQKNTCFDRSIANGRWVSASIAIALPRRIGVDVAGRCRPTWACVDFLIFS